MSSVGIIAEYNPFHNGHLYHLKKIKEMFPDDVIILVLAGNFTERGRPSIIDKFTKTKIAKEVGIDLIVELPFIFATQSADFFAHGSIQILEKLKVEKFVFGSETNDIDKFITLAKVQLENEDFDKLVKIYSKLGENYPTALSKALLDLTGKNMTLPNDLLGISYVKEVIKNNYKIKPLCIKRTNDYHDKKLNNSIVSATAVREALKNKENIKDQVPDITLKYLKKENLHFQDDYFKFLKYKILTEDNLNIFKTVDEGLGDKIKKEILNSNNYDELIKKVKSKRYTYNKINRCLNHILCDIKEKDVKDMKDIEYIRILGFNDKGKQYINKIKKDIDVPVIGNFSKCKSPMLQLELKVSSIYASTLDENIKNDFIKEEYKHHP